MGSFFLLQSCSKQEDTQSKISMIQIIDRMGMNETINQKEKLEKYALVDFEGPQPYQKVTRLIERKKTNQQKSIITTYHDNGFLKEYLEAVSQRANGLYKEYYPSGELKILAKVIEGIADVTDSAKTTYVFDGESKVFHTNSVLRASILYEKGKLQGESIYYHPNGKVEKKIPYKNDVIEGKALYFDESENLLGFTEYKGGIKDGHLIFYGDQKIPAFEEWYQKGDLIKGVYFDFSGKTVGEISHGFGKQVIFEDGYLIKQIEYKKGKPEGVVTNYYPSGNIASIYSIKDSAKQGEEWVYYDVKPEKPKLYLNWYQDELHGSIKTWYEDGSLESQKEMVHNLKHGQLIAWYQTGGIMLIEEYELGKLKEGAYFSKKGQEKVSVVSSGKGIATIHDKDGFFLHKVRYEKGEVLNE